MDIQNAFATTTGLDFTTSGLLLGSVLVVTFAIALQWAIWGDESDSSSFLISGILGVLVAGVVGWYPLWAIIFIFVLALLVVLKPFESNA